jgi:hypothetical protein
MSNHLARKDAGAERQDLRLTGLSALWKRSLTSHEGGEEESQIVRSASLGSRTGRKRNGPSKEGVRATWVVCEPWFVSELAPPWENPAVSAAKHTQIEMHHIRPLRKRRNTRVATSFNRLLRAMNRTHARTRLLRLSLEDPPRRGRWSHALPSGVSSARNKPCRGSWRAVCMERCTHGSAGRGWCSCVIRTRPLARLFWLQRHWQADLSLFCEKTRRYVLSW